MNCAKSKKIFAILKEADAILLKIDSTAVTQLRQIAIDSTKKPYTNEQRKVKITKNNNKNFILGIWFANIDNIAKRGFSNSTGNKDDIKNLSWRQINDLNSFKGFNIKSVDDVENVIDI